MGRHGGRGVIVFDDQGQGFLLKAARVRLRQARETGLLEIGMHQHKGTVLNGDKPFQPEQGRARRQSQVAADEVLSRFHFRAQEGAAPFRFGRVKGCMGAVKTMVFAADETARHKGALALHAVQKAGENQFLQGLAYGADAYAVLLGQAAFRGDQIARLPDFVFNLAAQALADSGIGGQVVVGITTG